MTESIELAEFLKQELKISPRILLNKVMQAPVNSTMCETLDMAASSEDFLSYLCSEVRESNKARQDLKDYRVTEMPHEFSNEPRELLNFLAEKVPSI